MEIDLMDRYPRTSRNSIRCARVKVSEADRVIARQFGREYFDGPRHLGMGGYHYHPRFFKPVVERMIEYYRLDGEVSILDVGCAKGFMLHDFLEALPEAEVRGIDISNYCLDHCLDSVKTYCQKASCDALPFEDNSFDLVVSIATIHNLDVEGVKKSLREMERVSRGNAFLKVNGYQSESERKELEEWNLVARTILHVNEWQALFKETRYTGDYYWFTP